MLTYGAVLSAFLISCTLAAEEPFSYDEQGSWPGICVTGNTNRQSPINIVTSQVQMNANLAALRMNGWNTGYYGEYENLGTTLQFTPNSSVLGQALTVTPVGIYEVQQFHMHWGEMTGQGSEHLVDGDQAELEIHFVHFRQSATDTSAGDFAAVVGVLADVDPNAPVSGTVWEQLIPVQTYMGSREINFRYDQLLPENLDYWFYEGSLTTPSCSEIVQWFVLQNRITVPGAFLDQLRTIQDTQRMPLTFNFRMAQNIGNRVVQEPGTSTEGTGKGTAIYARLMLSLIMPVLALFQLY